MLTVDHVILGVNDLEIATRRVEALGFGVVDGGRHPGLGTANRIVPFGGPSGAPQYLELLGVVDADEARRSPFGRALLDAIKDGDRLVRWCLQTTVADLDVVAARLQLTVEPRARKRPDGVMLTWRAAGLALSLAEAWLPFFVAWDHPDRHPGLSAVRHRRAPRAFTRIDVATGDRPWLDRWLQGVSTAVRLVDGPPRLHQVAIATEDGDVVVGAASA